MLTRIEVSDMSPLDGSNYAKALKCREKLERWLYPLAYWYLQKTEE